MSASLELPRVLASEIPLSPRLQWDIESVSLFSGSRICVDCGDMGRGSRLTRMFQSLLAVQSSERIKPLHAKEKRPQTTTTWDYPTESQNKDSLKLTY